MKQVVIKCQTKDHAKLESLKPFQGNLKTLTDENYKKLRKQIEQQGFSFPVFVWQLEDKTFLLDGHQRVRTLHKMQAEGYEIPEIPIVKVDAADYQEAKQKLLSATSQYGEIETQGLYEFITDAHLSPDYLTENLRLPEIDMAAFQAEFYDPPSEETAPSVEQEIPEELLDQCWVEYAKEFADQIDNDSCFGGMTPAFAKLHFLHAKYAGAKYLRYLSMIFQPHQMKTKGDKGSFYDLLRWTESGKVKTGRMRFGIGGDCENLTKLLKGSVPMAGCRIPLDFPADLAKDLMNEFAPEGRVLDPCHGWGGRLVGFLLSGAKQYYGYDASDLQNKGVNKIKDTFLSLAEPGKKVALECVPFEDSKLKRNFFDFALTSPPYYDVEQYIDSNGKQSWAVYKSYEEWRDGFYKTLISKVHSALKKGGHFALEVGSQTYPLIEDGKALAESIGFQFIEMRHSGMVNNMSDKDESLGENILIFRK